MTLPQIEQRYMRRKHELNTACDRTLDAIVHLANFAAGGLGWEEDAVHYPDTGPALLDSVKRAKQVLMMITGQHEQLVAAKLNLSEAWRRHRAAVAADARPQQVSADSRVAKSLAAQWSSLGEDEDPDTFRDMLQGLGLRPEGPPWAQWALEVHGDLLWWMPYLPAESDEDEPTRPWTGDEDDYPDAEDDPWVGVAPLHQEQTPVNETPAQHETTGAHA